MTCPKCYGRGCNLCREPQVTKVETSDGTFEVSTNFEGSTAAFGPDGQQIDFGYTRDHAAAVRWMRTQYVPGEDYRRIQLPPDRQTTEILHKGGGSLFRVVVDGQTFAVSVADKDRATGAPSKVVVTVPDGRRPVNFTLTNAEAISLMAFLSEVTA